MPSAEEILSDPDGIDWPSLRKSIKRINDRRRLSEILRLACPEADLPDDILPLVLKKWDCFDKRWNMRSEPWANQEVRRVICHVWVAWMTGVQPRLMHLENVFFAGASYAALPEKEQALLAVQSMDDLKRHPDMLKAWNKTEILLKFVLAEGYDRHDPYRRSPNYVVTMVKHGYPLLLVWLVAKLYPSQLRQRDDPPIHYAATQSMKLEVQKKSNQPVRRVTFSDNFQQSVPMGLLNRTTPVRLLGELCPQAGRMKSHYSWTRGALPLVSYLVHRPDSHAAPFDADDLQHLISLAPLALRTRSCENKWRGSPYPFLIPTNLCDNHRWQESQVQTNKPQWIGEQRYQIDQREASRRKQYEKEQLTAIYMLLRADPSMLPIASMERPPPPPAPAQKLPPAAPTPKPPPAPTQKPPPPAPPAPTTTRKRKYGIGTKVVKHFAGYGWFNGQVISNDGGEYYRVEYSDGDQEDLEEHELRSLCKMTMKQPKRARLDDES